MFNLTYFGINNDIDVLHDTYSYCFHHSNNLSQSTPTNHGLHLQYAATRQSTGTNFIETILITFIYIYKQVTILSTLVIAPILI